VRHRTFKELEDRRFWDRRRFDQGSFWHIGESEPRSLPQSTWPALAEAIKKWGIPAGFRLGTGLRGVKLAREKSRHDSCV